MLCLFSAGGRAQSSCRAKAERKEGGRDTKAGGTQWEERGGGGADKQTSAVGWQSHWQPTRVEWSPRARMLRDSRAKRAVECAREPPEKSRESKPERASISGENMSY